MSNEAYNWARKLHPGPGPKAVLLSLADRATDHSGEDWTCFPSIKVIVEDTDYSRPTVERHLKTLWREGYISRARRRRADGKLGIYDYTLHRDAERRAALKVERESVQDVDAAMEMAAPEADQPHVKLTYGPGVSLDGAMRQIEGQPCVNLMGQEPSEEPSYNPHSGGAREPGSQGFDALSRLWPESGLKRTDWPKARAAFALAAGSVEADRLVAAARKCAEDPAMAAGDYGFPGLHTWLAAERWRPYLPPAAGAAAAAVEAPRWAGPAALRAEILERLGGAFAATLDRCAVEGGRLIARTTWAHGRLREAADVIAKHGCELVAPNGGSQ